MEKYNGVARALHWSIAVLIICNLLSGILHEPLHMGAVLIPSHKAIGLTVLVLSVARLLWRLTWTHPPYPSHMPGWERGAATLVHVLLYVGMIGMPLSGWIFASASPRDLSWFGLFDWPKLPFAKGDALVGFSHEFHTVFGYSMAVVLVLHIAAALRHHFVLRDTVLRRML
nr:cytochrome b [Novosphingobium sp. 9]